MKTGLERILTFIAISLAAVTLLAYLNYCKLDKIMEVELEIRQSRQVADVKVNQIENKVDKLIDKELGTRQHQDQDQILADVIYSFDHVSFVLKKLKIHLTMMMYSPR